jgi:RES domain-containing protein
MRKIRDPDLLDRLQAVKPVAFTGTIWRMARAGRDPLVRTSPKGRWDDGSFEVLYTALSPDAALAEMHFHLTRSQPVFPSTLRIHLHEIACILQQVYEFASVEDLVPFGVTVSDYGGLGYARLQEEYAVTQQIGEAAHFLGGDGLMVPSARWPDQNLVVMSGDAKLQHVKDYGVQNLKNWGRVNNR